MSKISIEIREVENGFILEDSYFVGEVFFKTFEEAVIKATKLFNDFKEERLG